MATIQKNFKTEHPFEKRKAESSRILAKYPDRIPIIVEKSRSSDVPEIDKQKFLIPKDLTCGQFIFVIRKRIKLTPEKALFIFVNNSLLPSNVQMSVIYEKYKDEDGFCYVTYAGENTFGSL